MRPNFLKFGGFGPERIKNSSILEFKFENFKKNKKSGKNM
jgi:hypothetical protein